MPHYEFIGRYAEDLHVYVKAEDEEAALRTALEKNLNIMGGYAAGNLVPTKVSERSYQALANLRAGLVCGTCYDEGATHCNCYEDLEEMR